MYIYFFYIIFKWKKIQEEKDNNIYGDKEENNKIPDFDIIPEEKRGKKK